VVPVAGRDAAWVKAWAAAAVVAAGVVKQWARGEAAAEGWAGVGVGYRQPGHSPLRVSHARTPDKPRCSRPRHRQ
jgi:hypothetical protein